MKKVFGIIAFFLSSIFLFGKDIRFDIVPKFNLTYGTLNEFVFGYESKARYKLSELNWNLINSSSVGLETTAGYKCIDLSFSFAQFLPYKVGVMYDSDWQKPYQRDLKTNYSISDNNLKNGYDLTFEIAGHITPTKWLTIKPLTAINYYSIYFKSSNTEGWYGDKDNSSDGTYVSFDDSRAKHFLSNQLGSISYYRTTLNIFLGFNLLFTFLDKFTINTGFKVAPYTNVDSLDIHWKVDGKSGTMYNDRMYSYFSYFKANLDFEYKINSNIYLGISNDFSFISLFIGDTYEKKTGDSKYPEKASYPKGAGCSGYLYTISVYTAIRL